MTMRHAFACLLFLLTAASHAGPTFVVAQDGSGDFTSIQDAVDAMKSFPPERITIHVRPGVYREKLVVHEWNTRLSLIGEDAARTVISWDDHFERIARGRNSTFFTATMQVDSDDFVAKHLTIENTAGDIGQAIALAVNADRAVFRDVRLLGNQDTVYVTGEGKRVLFDDCYIEGTTDFIFGGASAVFRGCTLHAKKNSFMTAASTPPGQAFGFVFIDARLTAAPGIDAVYLGRPWRKYAQTVFLNCHMGAHIVPEGWHNWDNAEAEETVFYAEFGSRGPGRDAAQRVAWSRQLRTDDVVRFDVGTLLRSGHHPGWWQR